MRITMKQLLEDNGLETLEDLMQDQEFNGQDGTALAMCSEGCIVEPDGECEHGCPSWLVAKGLI